MFQINKFVLLSVIIGVWCNKSLLVNKNDEEEVIAEALKKILLEVFVPINKTINVITNEEKNIRLTEVLVRQMMENYWEVLSFEIQTYKEESTILEIYKKTTIFIIDHLTPTSTYYLTSGAMIYLFYIAGMSSAKYLEALDIYSGFYVTSLPNILLLIDEDDFLHLKMLTHFTETSCTKASLLNINRFSKASKQWELPNFNLTSLLKFHGCPMKTNCEITKAPEIIQPPNYTPNFDDYSGYFSDITRELSKRFNFTFTVSEGSDMKHIQIMFFGISTTFSSSYSSRQSYLTTINRNIYFLVPLGDYYTGLEKLSLPYDQIGWILIVLTFSVGLIVIQVVLRLSKIKQNFVFGRHFTSPTMNLFGAFFGASHTTLPGRNFARFILMLYIVWCLIIRTAYQGVLYELLKSDGRKQQTLSVDDFLAGNMTLHLNHFCMYILFNMPGINYDEIALQSRLQYFDESNVHDHLESVKNSSDHFMAIDDLQFAISNRQKFITGIKIMKNENIRIPLKFATVQGYFMEKLFESKLMQMQEAGLIEHWKRKYYDPKFLDLMEEEDEPKVLTLQHLSIGFQVFLLFTGLAIIVFVVETVKFKWHKNRNSTKVTAFVN